MSCWAEHLDSTDNVFLRPQTSECMRLVSNIAEENWKKYIQVRACEGTLLVCLVLKNQWQARWVPINTEHNRLASSPLLSISAQVPGAWCLSLSTSYPVCVLSCLPCRAGTIFARYLTVPLMRA